MRYSGGSHHVLIHVEIVCPACKGYTGCESSALRKRASGTDHVLLLEAVTRFHANELQDGVSVLLIYYMR